MSLQQFLYQQNIYKLNNIFCPDILFHLSEFLTDNESCCLFNTCKTINNIVKIHQRYSVKTIITDNLNVPSFYKITKMITSKHFAFLPKSLIFLKIFKIETEELIVFPSNLLTLYIDNVKCNIKIPETVQNLFIENSPQLNIDHLPESLKYLFIYGTFNIMINKLPKNLLHLGLPNEFNQQVDNLPSPLKYLNFGSTFNQSIDNLPHGLTHLILGYDFNKPINNLPDTIVYLVLGYKFKQPLPYLPKLKVLTVYDNYNQNLDHLPKTTKIVRI